ncbi:tetratricopeptide (TPR) repeat protein [Constrictibacter sp. MBR-5]|uniref:cellulose biosynthesis protein BcsC n=1 Tax=Constrictibacter sp. MBR-5 TaxID=3156467 RepID=UPI00339245C9
MSKRVGFGMGLLLTTALVPCAALAGQWTAVSGDVPAATGVDIAQATPRAANWSSVAQAAPSSGGWTNIAQAPAPTPVAVGATGSGPAAAPGQAEPPATGSAAEKVLLERGRYWKSRNRPELAMEAFERLLRSSPTHREGLLELGMLKAEQGDIEGARQLLSRLRAAHPQAGTQITRLEQAVRRGQVSPADVAQARQLAETGQYDRAARQYEQAFRGDPTGPYALEYYQTLAGSPGGFDRARSGLEEIVKSTNDPRARLALARVLTYRESTRREGIKRLEELSRTPAVATDAAAAWRQAVLWLSLDGRDRSYYQAYLNRYPNDRDVQARLSGTRTRTATASAPSGPPPSVRRRMQGFDELNQGDLADAEARFQEALRLNRGDSDALAGLGIVRLRQERFSEASELLGRAVNSSRATRQRYGQAYESARFWAGMEQSEAAMTAGRLDEAERILTGLARGNSSDASEARRALADVLVRQGKDDAAEREYQAVLQRDPNDVQAISGLFNLYVAQNRTDAALALSSRLDRTNVGSAGLGAEGRAEVLRMQAKQYELAGEGDAAFRIYQDAVVSDPSNPWVRLDFARFLARQGERGQAREMVQSMVDAPGTTPAALHAAAIWYDEQEMSTEAIYALDRVPVASQTSAMRDLRYRTYMKAQINRAKAFAEAGLPRESQRILDELYRLPPQTVDKTARVASAMADVGDSRRALAILRPHVSGGNAKPETQLQYVNVLLKSGQEAEAAAWIRSLEQNATMTARERRELAGKSADLAVMQADRAREAGAYADAYDILYPHLAQDPNNVNLLMALGRVYGTAGYTEEARSVYSTALELNPTDLNVIRGAVGAAIASRDHDYATSLLGRALEWYPREPRLYYLVGEVARSEGDMATARKSLETARALREQEIAAATTSMASPAGRVPLPNNPFRTLSPAVPTAGNANPFRPAGAGRNPFSRPQAALPAEAGPQTASSAKPVQIASADPRVDLAYVLPPPPSVSGRTPNTSADPAMPPYLQSQGSYPAAYVPYVPPTGSYGAPAPAARQAQARPPQTYPSPAGDGYVPPFIDPASRVQRQPDNLMSDIQTSLAQIRRETGPSFEGGIRFRGRDGDSGLDRLTDIQAPMKATFSPGAGRLTATLTPTYLNAGNVSSGDLDRFGLNPLLPLLDPGKQDAAGVGVNVGYGIDAFSVDLGVTPLGFDLINPVGGVSFAPMLDQNIGLKFTLEQRAVTDSLLSYAGAEDARTEDLTWGGVTRRGGRVELNYDDGAVGAYVNGAYYKLQGEDTETNDMFEMNLGAYYRFIQRRDEELKVGGSLSYFTYDKNLRYFTMGHGGYFSPQSYVSFSVPAEYIARRDRVTYMIGGAIGIQDWEEDATPVFPHDSGAQAALEDRARTDASAITTYAAEDDTGIGLNVRGQIEYEVNRQTSIGAAASMDSAADWFEATGLIYLRHTLGGDR